MASLFVESGRCHIAAGAWCEYMPRSRHIMDRSTSRKIEKQTMTTCDEAVDKTNEGDLVKKEFMFTVFALSVYRPSSIKVGSVL